MKELLTKKDLVETSNDSIIGINYDGCYGWLIWVGKDNFEVVVRLQIPKFQFMLTNHGLGNTKAKLWEYRENRLDTVHFTLMENYEELFNWLIDNLSVQSS